MTTAFKSANPVESARFSAQIAVPNVILGLFRRRTLPTKAAALIGLDAAAYALMEGLASKYGPDPFWVKVVTDDTLIVHHPDDIRWVLEGSPADFASDPDAKRKGMAAFQPDALTISRGDVWRQRRDFAEAVLDTGKPLHGLAREFVALAVEEADALVSTAAPVDWETFNLCVQRMTRCVVFGRGAADDTDLTEQLGRLMDAANGMPGKPADGYDDFVAHIQRYLDDPEEGSLASLIAGAPDAPGGAAGQTVHWLFAMGDTLAANAFRTLAVLATHPDDRTRVVDSVAGADLLDPAVVAGLDHLAGCVQEAMRLWPTTPMFGRVALVDVHGARGVVVPAGTPVLIVNSFNHRNRDRVPYADAFTPTAWTEGDAADNWLFNFFSHGPQGCPGAGLSILLAQALLGRLLASADLGLSGPKLDPAKPLPHALDITGLSVTLS